MSLFGFLGEAVEAGIRVVTTPITIVEDVISPLSGGSGKETSKNIKSIGKQFRECNLQFNWR